MEIKFNEKLNAKGLYATKKYVKNDVVFTLSGKEYDHPTRETIYVGNNTHVYDEHGIFMNHSFTPTTFIKLYEVIANVNIEINDELTFDYNDSELNMANPFTVDGVTICGNDNNKIENKIKRD